MTKGQREQLHNAMAQAGWIAKKDLFGSVYEWHYKANGKRISNALVEQYWLTTGQTPTPF